MYYIINALAGEDLDFEFGGKGAFDAIGELLVDSGYAFNIRI